MPNTTVSRFKISQAKEALIENPSITSKQLATALNCCFDSANLALKQAKTEIQEASEDIQKRAGKLRRERLEKALDSAELQIRERLDKLRENADTLQEIAEESPNIINIEAANKAWKLLTDYERTVTGIAQAEKAEVSREGKTEISLSIPMSPEMVKQIKPVDPI